MPAPSGLKYELEFTAGVFTDLTTDVDAGQATSITIGRTSPQGQPQTGQASLRLRNPTGKYTPGVQILSDGTTAPYFPNVLPRKRLRISNSSGTLFVGYVKSWSPVLVNGVAGYCQIVATDRMEQLSRVTLTAGLQAEILVDNPVAYWPMGEVAGASTANDASGVNTIPLRAAGPSSPIMIFGQGGPGTEQGSSVLFQGGTYLHNRVPLNITLTAFSIETWTQFSTTPSTIETIVSFADSRGIYRDIATGSGGPSNGLQFLESDSSIIGGIGSPSSAMNDGAFHHCVYTQTAATGTGTLYVDGALIGTGIAGQPSFGTITGIKVGAPTNQTIAGSVEFEFAGNASDVALYDHVLTPARVLAHFNAAQQSAELTSDKVARFLSYDGLTSADWNIDTSTVLTGTYAQDGKDILTACQDMAITEGGGSVFYITPDGKARFTDRSYRSPAAPVLTVSAAHDIDGGTWTPSLDDQNLVNQSTVSRSTESGTQTTLTDTDLTSVGIYGLTTLNVASYTATDLDALNLAQSIVAAGRTPGFRLPRVTVDLYTATTSLYAAVQNIQIGSRIRVNTLPSGQSPASQLDVIVEGWTTTIGTGVYQVAYDCSPADNPAAFVWSDTTYGHWQALTDCALNASISNAATTVAIRTPTAPHFTTTAAVYTAGLYVKVDAEIIKLGAAPGSGTPQTFTGCTRGQFGTTQAAHTSGAAVTLYPASTWTL